jgi:hypothetical protein
VSVIVVPMTASHPAAERVAAVFDEYRWHYGQLPAPVATQTWLLDQLGCQRMALTAALDEADQCHGFITTTAMPASLMLGTAWSIRDLYVAPDYRRGGIAGAGWFATPSMTPARRARYVCHSTPSPTTPPPWLCTRRSDFNRSAA